MLPTISCHGDQGVAVKEDDKSRQLVEPGNQVNVKPDQRNYHEVEPVQPQRDPVVEGALQPFLKLRGPGRIVDQPPAQEEGGVKDPANG